MNTTESNEPVKQSALNSWMIRHGELLAAVKDACQALARHLTCLPDPQDESETETLLAWRYAQFGLPYEPANNEGIRLATNSAAETLFGEARSTFAQAARQLLNNIETVRGIDARANRNGLFSPASLPARLVQIRGDYSFTMLGSLPPDHPLRSIGDDARLPEICLGPASFLQTFDGVVRHVLPPWRTVESVKREVEAARAEQDKRDALAKQEAQEHRERLEVERLRHLTLEQREIRALKNELAEMRALLASKD